MDKKMSVLVSAVCLLLGVIIGFFAAPVKKGIYCGNYNAMISADSRKGKTVLARMKSDYKEEKGAARLRGSLFGLFLSFFLYK